MKFFKVSDLVVLMTISRNKRRPEEDSHSVRLSSKKRRRKKKHKMEQMFFGVSGLQVKSGTVNF